MLKFQFEIVKYFVFKLFFEEMAITLNTEKIHKRGFDLGNDDLYNYLDDMSDYQNLIKKAKTTSSAAKIIA